MPGWTLGHPKPTPSFPVCPEKAVTHPCSSQAWGSLWSHCHRGKRPQSVPISGVLPPQAPPGAFPVLRWPRAACFPWKHPPASGIKSRGSSGISTSSRGAGTPLQTLALTALSIQIAPEIIRSAGACWPQRASRPRLCEGSSALQSQLPPVLLQGQPGPRGALSGDCWLYIVYVSSPFPVFPA